MLTTIRQRLNSDEGFTLVELLVVILIIGILAAIAIPSFLNQKGKGEDAAAKSAAREAATAMETYYTDKGDYASATPALLKGIEGTLPAGATADSTGGAAVASTDAAHVGLLWVTSTATTYTIRVWSKPSGRVYSIDKDATGNVLRSCGIVASTDSKGGCTITSGTTGSW